MIDVIVSKRCGCCGDMLLADAYSRDLSTVDGYKHSCKACISAKDRRRYEARKSRGIVRSRKPVVRMEPLWPLPTYTLTDSLDCIQLRKWRGPVSREPLRASL